MLPWMKITIRALRRPTLPVVARLLCFFVWLSGFVLLAIYQHRRTVNNLRDNKNYILDGVLLNKNDILDRVLPSITVFSAPRPFASGETSRLVRARQELAVRSWLAASPQVAVVLFGNHPSVRAFAARLGPRVAVESAIDFTFLGTPFFHSMVARSQASDSNISIFVDPETILLPDFMSILNYAHQLSHDWFMISVSRNVSFFPFQLDDNGKQWLQQNGKKVDLRTLQGFLIQKQDHRNCGKRLIMAWNKGDTPLHAGTIPSFLYGKGKHNAWLVNEVFLSEFRFIFDASDAVSGFYPESLGKQYSAVLKDSGFGSERTWEYMGNHHLATMYGSFYFRSKNTLNNLIKLVKCLGQYIFINPAKRIIFLLQGPDQHGQYTLKSEPGGYQDKSHRSSRQSRSKGKWIPCVKDVNQIQTKNECSFMDLDKVACKTSMPLLFPFSLESLLQLVADKDKSVVLAVAGNNYRDMLMSWVCRLRRLLVTNFVVCALDPEVFKFSVLQGLPVFRDPLAPKDISFNNCHFGTECFQRVTKVKSRIVLQILKLGYNVLMSDVDVYWFDNPLPFLHSFGPSTLLAQSDEYNETVPINLPRRLNSGFYFARSDPFTIAAMERVVKHASSSGLSEQPSFYDVLCGVGGVNRVGNDQCVEPNTNLTVLFLDRDRFPNGAYKGLWEKRDVRSACFELGCVIIHNNWINGRKRKLERQVHSGLWEYDPASRQCLQNWQQREQ